MLIYPRQSDFKDTSTITFGYCWNEGLTSRQCFIYNKTFVILYYKIILYNYVLNTLWNIPKLLRYVKIDQFTLFFFLKKNDPFGEKRLKMDENESKFWEDLVKK